MIGRSDSNMAAIKRFFAAASAGDDILDILAVDATWRVPAHLQLAQALPAA